MPSASVTKASRWNIDADELLAPAPDGTPASEDFGDLIVSDCFIPQIVYSTTFGYRTDLVGDTPPTNICDVFDLENYPGKRALEKRPINNMEWALLCDGVAKADVYDVLETEEGQAPALAKLDTIKDQVVWWSAGADTPQLLADGEVVMGSTYNGRLFSLIEEQDQPVAMLWDAQVFDLDGWIIPAGLPADRLARVKDFVMFATDTQRLADQAKYISYGPARKSSAPLVGKHADLGIEMAPHMPTDPENAKNTFLYNYTWWADYRDDLDAKFQAWLAQ
jgi:putative spermidine/putrescine transport system substrate-binding protein